MPVNGFRFREAERGARRQVGRRATLAAASVIALVVAGVAPAGAQGADEPSVWDGVYSEAQAERGRQLYEASCARCHGDDLSGANARPLAGESFIRDWGGLKLDGS